MIKVLKLSDLNEVENVLLVMGTIANLKQECFQISL